MTECWYFGDAELITGEICRRWRFVIVLSSNEPSAPLRYTNRKRAAELARRSLGRTFTCIDLQRYKLEVSRNSSLTRQLIAIDMATHTDRYPRKRGVSSCRISFLRRCFTPCLRDEVSALMQNSLSQSGHCCLEYRQLRPAVTWTD